MDNYKILSEAIVKWLNPRIMDMLKTTNPVNRINQYLSNNTQFRSFVNLLGVNLTNYNVANELGFLVNPLLNRYINTQIKSLGSQEDIIPFVKDVVSSALLECQTKTKPINIFGIELNEEDLIDLNNQLNSL